MRELLTAIAAAAAGAAAMYYLDPDTGRRRRALVRDKAVSVTGDAGDFAREQGRRASNRMKGIAATARTKLHIGPRDDSDRKLHERVRSSLGRVVSYPGAIEADVSNGEVRLFGDILEAEVEALLSDLRAVHGVRSVVNSMTAHEEADGVPSMQGSNDRRGRNGAFRRGLGTLLPVVAVAAPIALMVAAASRPSSRLPWSAWHARNPLARFTPTIHHRGPAARARRYVKELWPS